MQFDYFYGNEAEQFTFYRIPKLLISSPQFKTVSDSAKLLYGLMLDRMSLSIRNGWFDEQGRAYIFYKLNDIEEDMNCSTGKGVKLLAELDTKKGIGLIERIKQGQGKADKIYLKKFVNVDKSQTYSRVTNDEKQDLQKLDVQTSKNCKSILAKTESADLQETERNNNKYNNTDVNNINSINQDVPNRENSTSKNERWIDRYNKTVTQIKKQIDYDTLIATNNTGLINDIVEVMTDVMLVDTTYYTIGKKEIPAEMVRIRYGQLTYGKIEALLLDLDDVTWTIHNKTPYLISALYNTSKTGETSITNRVKRDIYGGEWKNE